MSHPGLLSDYLRKLSALVRRLVIDLNGKRFPAARLAAPAGLTFANASEVITNDLARLSQIASPERMPFTVASSVDGMITKTVERFVGRTKALDKDGSHLWLTGLGLTGVTVECAAIEHINSHIIEWLLKIAQAAKPITVRLIHVGAKMLTQVRQLRLDHLFVIA